MFRDSVIAAIRTAVAAVVTLVLAWVVQIGVELDPSTANTLNILLFGVAIAGYNLLVGLLERNVHPYFGILLGIPKAPEYGTLGTKTTSNNP